MRKNLTIFSCFDIFYSLTIAADIVIYMYVVIINGNLLKYVAFTAKPNEFALTMRPSSKMVTSLIK